MKTISLVSAFLMSGIYGSTIRAQQLVCQNIRWEGVKKEHIPDPEDAKDLLKVFRFHLTQECTLTTSKDLDLTLLKNHYTDFITNNPTYKVRGPSQPISQNGMNGISFSLREVRNTNNGTLTIDGKISLLDNGASNFRYDYSSSRVVGTSNAKYTQFEEFTVDATAILTAPHTYRLVFSQVNLIRKPTLAPEGYFIEKAQEGIEKDLGPRRDEHAKIMTK